MPAVTLPVRLRSAVKLVQHECIEESAAAIDMVVCSSGCKKVIDPVRPSLPAYI
jgi:hypothetical protein